MIDLESAFDPKLTFIPGIKYQARSLASQERGSVWRIIDSIFSAARPVAFARSANLKLRTILPPFVSAEAIGRANTPEAARAGGDQ